MAYNVYFSCDSCGAAYNWVNHAVSYSAAVSIARIDYVLQKVCGGYFQPFFERNELIKDWWDR
jgi:hypothetical protein